MIAVTSTAPSLSHTQHRIAPAWCIAVKGSPFTVDKKAAVLTDELRCRLAKQNYAPDVHVARRPPRRRRTYRRRARSSGGTHCYAPGDATALIMVATLHLVTVVVTTRVIVDFLKWALSRGYDVKVTGRLPGGPTLSAELKRSLEKDKSDKRGRKKTGR